MEPRSRVEQSIGEHARPLEGRYISREHARPLEGRYIRRLGLPPFKNLNYVFLKGKKKDFNCT